MARRRFQPTRSSFGLPTIVLLALSLGLWCAWTTVQPKVAPTRQPAKTRIRFVEIVNRAAESRGDLLVFMAPILPALSIVEDVPIGLGSGPAEAQPHLLGRRAEKALELENLTLMPSLRRQALGRLVDYRPVWPIEDPFVATSPRPMCYDVQVSSDLTRCGFLLPDDSLTKVAGGERDWDLVFDVTCGTDGRTRDVLLLSAPDASGVFSNVVRVLYEGKSAPGMTGRGRVNVRWGQAEPQGSKKEQVWPPKS